MILKLSELCDIITGKNIAQRCVVAIAGANITFMNDKAHSAFRQLLKHYNASVEELPKGSFRESGTMTNSVIIVINK